METPKWMIWKKWLVLRGHATTMHRAPFFQRALPHQPRHARNGPAKSNASQDQHHALADSSRLKNRVPSMNWLVIVIKILPVF